MVFRITQTSSRREFQVVCPNLKNLIRKEVKDQKKCDFYVVAYRRRNVALIKFTKACVPNIPMVVLSENEL